MIDPNKFYKVLCVFCGQDITGDFFPGNCSCEKWKVAHNAWKEEWKNDPAYVEPLTNEDYDKKFPQIFREKWGRIVLEARKFEDGIGLCISRLFEDNEEGDDTGLCWDFTDEEAVTLYNLLGNFINLTKK
jgi:hypothetical protein